jgi:hypothetical protein
MAGKSYIKTGTYNWSKIKKMYLKTGATTWTAIRKAYIKTGTYTWKKIFDTSSNRPFIENNDYPAIRLNTYRSTSTSGVQPPVNAAPVQFIGPRSGGSKGTSTPSPTSGYAGGDGIGAYLWGYDGDWFPNTGVTFTYDWFWSNTSNANDATAQYVPASASGADDKISNVNANLGWLVNNEPNGVWLYFRVNASNSSGTARAISAPVKLIRQEPAASTWSIQSPASSQLNTPKYITTSISNLWYDAPHFNESKVEWFSESSDTSPLLNSTTLVKTEYLNSFSSGTEASGTAITDQPSYTPVNVNSRGYSDADKYIYARLTLINSYTKHTGATVTIDTKTTVPVGQTRSITPQWNDYIGVSTNGYIGIGSSSDWSSVDDTSTSGHVLSIFDKDLKQISLKYYADSTKYVVDYSGKIYDVASNTVTYRYQAHFYPGQNYVDVHFINYGGGASANAYLYNGGQQVAWLPRSAGSAFRVTLTSGVSVQAITYNPLSTVTNTFTSVTTNDQVDDNYTVLQLIQGVSAPVLVSNPYFQLISGSSNKAGAVYRLYVGTWSGSPTSYEMHLMKNNQAGDEMPGFPVTLGGGTTYYDWTATESSHSLTLMVYATNSGGTTLGTALSSFGPITANLSAPTVTGVAWNGTSFTVSSTGGAGPYFQLWYNTTGNAPNSSTGTGYDFGAAASSSFTWTPGFTPAAGTTYYFWLRSAKSASASTYNVDMGDYSSSYASVTIPGPSSFTYSLYDSTATPNTPSLSVTTSSGQIDIDWADDANATGGWYSYITGGTQGARNNIRTVSYDFWSATANTTYSGGVYAINTNKQVTLNWGYVSGAGSFEITYAIGTGSAQTIQTTGSSYTWTTSSQVNVYYIKAYANSNYTGVWRYADTGTLQVTATNKTSNTATYTKTYTPTITYGGCIYEDRTVYGTSYNECSGLQTRTCTPYTTYYKRLIYSDGVSTGTYDTSGCTTTGTGTSCTTYAYVNGSCGYTLTCTASCGAWSAYSAYGSYTAYGSCYSTGSTAQKDRTRDRTRTRTCTATDCSTYIETQIDTQVQSTACTVTKWQCTSYDVNNSASTNYYDCFTVGACTAPRDPSAGRTSCAFA